MSIYLIDYENVKNLKGIEKLSDEDTVVIFYSKNANQLTFDTHKEILQSKAKVEYKFVSVGGKNALDFQLSTYLGYLIGKSGQKQFNIVSKDNGFANIATFWKAEKSIEVKLLAELSGLTQTKDAEVKTTSINDCLRDSSLPLSDNEREEVAKIINQYKTKQSINTNLCKYFKDNDKVGKIMKVIRPHLKDKK